MSKGTLTLDGLIERLEELRDQVGEDTAAPVLIDCGQYLAMIEDIDLGASDEGVIIWCGDRVNEVEEAA